jgi:hypothetical protein
MSGSRCHRTKPIYRPLRLPRTIKPTRPPRGWASKPDRSHYPDYSWEQKAKSEHKPLPLAPSNHCRNDDYDDQHKQRLQAFRHGYPFRSTHGLGGTIEQKAQEKALFPLRPPPHGLPSPADRSLLCRDGPDAVLWSRSSVLRFVRSVSARYRTTPKATPITFPASTAQDADLSVISKTVATLKKTTDNNQRARSRGVHG